MLSSLAITFSSRVVCSIHWTADTQRPSVEDVQVCHRRAHVLMQEQFLHGANVVTVFEQVRRK